MLYETIIRILVPFLEAEIFRFFMLQLATNTLYLSVIYENNFSCIINLFDSSSDKYQPQLYSSIHLDMTENGSWLLKIMEVKKIVQTEILYSAQLAPSPNERPPPFQILQVLLCCLKEGRKNEFLSLFHFYRSVIGLGKSVSFKQKSVIIPPK